MGLWAVDACKDRETGVKPVIVETRSHPGRLSLNVANKCCLVKTFKYFTKSFQALVSVTLAFYGLHLET
jgi:hypothetical protein